MRRYSGGRTPTEIRSICFRASAAARSALCRGGLHVRSRAHGRRRAFFYACTSHYNRGPEVCRHVDKWPMDAIDRAVLAAIAGDVLDPACQREGLCALSERGGTASGDSYQPTACTGHVRNGRRPRAISDQRYIRGRMANLRSGKSLHAEVLRVCGGGGT